MRLIVVLMFSCLFAQELEVTGDLKVTGTIQNDSLMLMISNLQAQITALQNQLMQLECFNTGNIPNGYCDCFGNTLDVCGVCGGGAINNDMCFTNFALSFNGIDNYIVAPESDILDALFKSYQPAGSFFHNSFSISMDVSIDLESINFESVTFPGAQLISKGYIPDNEFCAMPTSMQVSLLPGNSGLLSFNLGGDSIGELTTYAWTLFPNNDWVTLTFAFESLGNGSSNWSPAENAQMSIYLNGNMVAQKHISNSGANWGIPHSIGQPLYVGARLNSNGQSCMAFIGLIDNISISANWNIQHDEFGNGTVLNWNFNEGGGNIIYDSSGDHDGVINGSSYWVGIE